MKTSTKFLVASFLGALLAFAACSGDDNAPAAGTAGAGGSGTAGSAGSGTAGDGTSGAGTAGSGTAGAATGGTAGTGTGGTAGGGTGGAAGGNPDGGTPAPPMLGQQIDRLGRPGVNTALTDPFDIVAGKSKDQVKDDYNAEANPAMWSPKFKGYIVTNLAILDALDSRGGGSPFEGCGNQLAAGPATDGGGATRYDALAGVLADDRLYLNTQVSDAGTLTCGQYLAVEANATNIVPNNDCGGRTLKYDVIDTTYSVLAAGALMGVSDGVGPDGKPTATFPFLAAPQ
jgi:hypothetical protein